MKNEQRRRERTSVNAGDPSLALSIMHVRLRDLPSGLSYSYRTPPRIRTIFTDWSATSETPRVTGRRDSPSVNSYLFTLQRRERPKIFPKELLNASVARLPLPLAIQ